MNIRWYHRYTLATIMVALGLNLFPHFVKYDETPVAIGPVDSYQVHSGIPSFCHLQGAPAGYTYSGWPLVSYGPNDECRSATRLYAGNTAINTLIASGVTAAGWLLIKLIKQRSVK